jgi:hypothetical protein
MCVPEIYLLSFCLDDLSAGENVALMSLTVIMLGSVYVFMFSSVCFMKLCVLMFDVYMFAIVIFSCWIVPYQYEVIFFVSSDKFGFEFCFVRYEYSFSSLSLGSIY